MNKLTSFYIIIFFLLVAASMGFAQAGAGDIGLNEFEKCLADNCDAICKEVGGSIGNWDFDVSCHCYRYKGTAHATILENDWKIKIEGCSYPTASTTEKIETMSATLTSEQTFILVIIAWLIILSIIVWGEISSINRKIKEMRAKK